MPPTFNSEMYESYLKENFDYAEITDFKSDENIIHLKNFESNLKSCFYKCSKAEPIFIKVLKNHRRKDLYSKINKNIIIIRHNYCIKLQFYVVITLTNLKKVVNLLWE